MSCRGGGGSGGGLLGTETRDAVAAEKSLITHSAGGGTPPRARTPETQGSSSLRGPLPAAPPPLPLARARAHRPRVRTQRTHLTCARPAPCPTPTQAETHRPTRIRSPGRNSPPPPPPGVGASASLRQFPSGHSALGKARSPAASFSAGPGFMSAAPGRMRRRHLPSFPFACPLPPPPPPLAGGRASSSCARALVPPLPMPRETGGYGGAGEEH